MATCPATSRWTCAGAANAGESPYRWVSSSVAASLWHDKRLRPIHRRGELIALNRAGWVYMLGADFRALTHECASPDPLVLRENFESFRRPLVARVEIVALREGDGRGPDEVWIQSIDRARRIAEHAVDAHAVLLVLVQLVRRLEMLPFGDWLLFVADDPGLHGNELAHEVADLHDEIADDGKVGERLHLHWSGRVVGEECRAGQLGLAVHHHPAASAHAHAARPAIRQRAVELVLHMVQSVEDHPVLGTGNLVFRERHSRLDLGAIPRHLHRDSLGHVQLPLP